MPRKRRQFAAEFFLKRAEIISFRGGNGQNLRARPRVFALDFFVNFRAEIVFIDGEHHRNALLIRGYEQFIEHEKIGFRLGRKHGDDLLHVRHAGTDKLRSTGIHLFDRPVCKLHVIAD